MRQRNRAEYFRLWRKNNPEKVKLAQKRSRDKKRGYSIPENQIKECLECQIKFKPHKLTPLIQKFCSKKCRCKYNWREWGEKNPERRKDMQKKWVKEHPKRVKETWNKFGRSEKRKQWRERNKNKIQEWGRNGSKKWRDKHPERAKEVWNKWVKENPERYKEIHKKYTHSEHGKLKQKEYNDKYAKTDNGKQAIDRANKKFFNTERGKLLLKKHSHLYRARYMNAEGSFTVEEWLKIRNKTKGICLMCKKDVGLEKLTIDHIIPLSKGGTNYITNIQPLCFSCNIRKSNNI